MGPARERIASPGLVLPWFQPHPGSRATREKPLAIITGASSGIGLGFAEALAARGMDLLVIARRGARLDALADRLMREHGVGVRVMPADLLDDADLRGVEDALRQADRIDLLVNCAGFGTYGPFTAASPERIKNELLLDLVVPVALTRAALPGMRSRGTGAILNVSSMAGFMPIPKHATYCAAKAGLTRFTEALHGELAGTGVQVLAHCPGPVPTEFFAISGYDLNDVPACTCCKSARDCAGGALGALQRSAAWSMFRTPSSVYLCACWRCFRWQYGCGFWAAARSG